MSGRLQVPQQGLCEDRCQGSMDALLSHAGGGDQANVKNVSFSLSGLH